ncbi:MAG: ion transporter [Bacteroidales bacterium]|nr:ion transporter [Bacteroidales bacterium]MCF8454818.1 ion transporter [Bacteroidales bacterium]
MTQKEKLYDIIFEADTPSGKFFDNSLLVTILLSILFVMLESVSFISTGYGKYLKIAEWCITIIFTLEYALRIWVVNKPFKYIFSFYGIIDFLSILPTYIAIFLPGGQSLMVIRALRLLRVFRILKISRYVQESQTISKALHASRAKISVFLFVVLISVIIIGTIMYLIEGEEHGFTSIPRSIYWAIVTITTVGYGDIAPQTALGQLIASFTMILGYAIIAVPTGIVSAEFSKAKGTTNLTTQVCPECLAEGHAGDATFCKFCGHKLNE